MEISSMDMIMISLNWSKDTLSKLESYGKLKTCNEIVFVIQKNTYKKGLFNVIILSNVHGYPRNYCDLYREFRGPKEAWNYIGELTKAKRVITKNILVDYESAFASIPSYKIADCREGQMIIVFGEFDSFIFKKINGKLMSYREILRNECNI